MTEIRQSLKVGAQGNQRHMAGTENSQLYTYDKRQNILKQSTFRIVRRTFQCHTHTLFVNEKKTRFV